MGPMIAVLLALALQSPPDLGTRKTGADWPSFLGLNRDGTSPERGIAAWPPAGPRRVWERELAESYAAPSISRGRLFIFDRPGKYRLSCLKAETGEPLWTYEYGSDYADGYGAGNGPRCCPVVDDDRVYLVGPEGLLHCLRAENGALLWKKDTSEEFGVVPNFFGVGSTPIVEGDLLIALVGGSPPNSPNIMSGEIRGNGSGIVAFDKRTGEVKYKITDELASYSSPVVATIRDRRWGFVLARGGLVAFEPSTGKVDFRFPWRARAIQSVNAATPVVAGDLVFVSEAYSVGGALLRVKTGAFEVVWQDGRRRDPAMACWWNTPIHVDGHLYGDSGMGDGELRCVELATGRVTWSQPRFKHASLLRVDGHFIGLTEDGVLHLLRLTPEHCEEVSTATLAGPDGRPLLAFPARAAPGLSHGLLYVRGKDRLVCLEVMPP
jgi:outer membrane protein assembly factor BamB